MAGEDKNFIKERITGRRTGPGTVIKKLLLALFCGLVFGTGAFAAFSAAEKLEAVLQERAEAAESDEEEAAELDEDADAAEDVTGNEVADGGDESDMADAGEGPGAGAEDDETISGLLEGDSGAALREEIDAEISKQLDKREYTAEDMAAIARAMEKMAEEAGGAVAEVHAMSTNTTWFEDTVESQETFAGLVIEKNDSEILILTTASAVQNRDSLSVVFSDGTETEAHVKQVSDLDNISVIAVSNQYLDEEFLDNLKICRENNAVSVKPGSMAMAVGAPLGVVGSINIGMIAAVSEEELTADSRQEVFYSSMVMDPQHGTFILNREGELIGLASTPDEQRAGGSDPVIISTSYLGRVINKLKLGEELPYLGIRGTKVSTQMIRGGMPQGLYITLVDPEGPAYAAGIQNGDIITMVGNASIIDMTTYENTVRLLKSGQNVTVSVMRSSANSGYAELSFDITVGLR